MKHLLGIDDLGADGIGEDALARMKCIGTARRERLVGFAARAGLGLFGAQLDERKVIDGARPGELGIVEGGIVARRGGKIRKRQGEKSEMPEAGGDYSAAGGAAVDPAVLEEAAAQEFARRRRATHQNTQAAEKTLAECAPAHTEFGLLGAGQAHETSWGVSLT